MSLPDQKYMNHVRDALWSHAGHASVMVGSGFSKYAQPARPDAGELPLWHELAMAMFEKLHPPTPSDGQQRTPVDFSDPNDALKLAQEFKDSFGRSSLHLFLQQQIRDGDFNPGEFHRRLLKLPWRDVFTTNWDTLLERTRLTVPERPHSVVHNKDEIPLSAQPRIIKLHGSLDGHYPLIVTEQDYQTYPEQYAPFVNTVQQAMMETVFCLIGFSGRDPNFMEWSRWVNENLGESAPRIYVAGWLELSDEEREQLQALNVVAIDLARHPEAVHWPKNLHHRYATDWILHSLEGGRPYDVADWPTPHTLGIAEPPPHLKPVEVVTSDNPVEEPWSPRSSSDSQSIEDSTSELLIIWKKNRSLYPGWPVAPLEARGPLISRTRAWQPTILQVLNSLSAIERLDAIRELVWRHEITLEPITSELESAAQDAMSPISDAQPSNSAVEPHNVSSQNREAWREIALSLVTVARHRLDEGTFTRWIETATQFLDDSADVGHRIHHERCLWSAWSLDFEALDGLLTDWNTENCDPIWMLRKAALLSEAGRDEEAVKLTEQAIADIRRFPVDDRSVAGPSREGWALWSTIDRESRAEVLKRWNELASRNCDAYAEMTGFIRTLSSKGDSSNPPPFDLGTVRDGWSIRFESGNRLAPAFRAIRLSEVAGLPAATPQAFPSRATGADVLRLAAEHLVKFNPELAVRLVLRSCTYDKDKSLMRVLSRNHLALLPDDAVQRLAKDCIRMIDYSLPRGWVERIRVTMEVLSRLVSRLESDSALETFDYAFEMYRKRQHRVLSHAWIGPPLKNLLSRAWKSLSQNQRTNRAHDLLGAPIVGLDDYTVQIPEHYPDPGELASRDSGIRLPGRIDDNEAQWRDVIDLLIRALRTGGEARKRAANRLAPMVEGFLTEAETSEVADALWAAQYVPADSLPTGTSLFDIEFLNLPEPEPRLADQRFRRKWLTRSVVKSRHDVSGSGGTVSVSLGASPNNSAQLEDTLWHLGGAIAELRDRGASFDLTDAEREHVVDLVSQWANTPVTSHPDVAMQFEMRRYSLWAVDALTPILSQVEVPEPIGETLFQKLKTLTESGTPAFGPIGCLVGVIPHRAKDLASWLRTGLASSSRDMASGALSGLASWLHVSNNSDSSAHSPPEDVLRELGLIVAARRKESLSEALQVAKKVFDDGSDDQRDVIFNSVLDGLEYLAEELRYDGEHDDSDVPNLRWRCAQLASSMSRAGFGNESVVGRWVESASTDPFPEVRNVPLDDLRGSLIEGVLQQRQADLEADSEA